MNYERHCPQCNGKILYSLPSNFYRAKKKNVLCKTCSQIGRKFSDESKKKMREKKIGGKQSYETRLKNSNTQKKRYSDPFEKKKMSIAVKLALHRPDVRQRHINAMAKNHFLGNSMDVGQLELLEKWNRLGFNFSPNYQIHTDNFLCYIDGYDKENNVVLEYDGKYHQTIGQKTRDLIRQQRIIDIIHPKKFWRYDSINKCWNNVVGDK